MFCAYGSYGNYRPFTVFSKPCYVSSFSSWFEIVNPCFVTYNNYYKLSYRLSEILQILLLVTNHAEILFTYKLSHKIPDQTHKLISKNLCYWMTEFCMNFYISSIPPPLIPNYFNSIGQLLVYLNLTTWSWRLVFTWP